MKWVKDVREALAGTDYVAGNFRGYDEQGRVVLSDLVRYSELTESQKGAYRLTIKGRLQEPEVLPPKANNGLQMFTKRR